MSGKFWGETNRLVCKQEFEFRYWANKSLFSLLLLSKSRSGFSPDFATTDRGSGRCFLTSSILAPELEELAFLVTWQVTFSILSKHLLQSEHLNDLFTSGAARIFAIKCFHDIVEINYWLYVINIMMNAFLEFWSHFIESKIKTHISKRVVSALKL